RRSMEIYTSLATPTMSFLKSTSFVTTAGDKKSPTSMNGSHLFKPLISSSSSEDDEEVPTSTLATKLSCASDWRTSLSGIPPLQRCSYAQSILNAVNVLCGIGILSTPYALKEGGWLSLILLFVLGVITCYTGILLKRCLESSSQLQTYPDIGSAAFGTKGRICIAAILYVELYSSCVEYLIMMTDALSAYIPTAHVDVAGIHLNSYQICAVTSTLIILPTVWLRNLSLLSYISVGGVVTLALIVICLIWVGVVSEIGFHPSGNALNLTKVPIAIGIYSFCYGSHSVFPNIYSSMEEPSQFPSVLIISFLISGLLYGGVAVCAFLMFGEATNSQFTLNMPSNSVASNVAGWSVVLAPLTKFGLSMTPVALAIEELFPATHVQSHTLPILIRTLLTFSTLAVALAFPYFGSMMALIGSFLEMVVCIILPCACYLMIQDGKLSKVEIGSCCTMIMVGVLCAISGTYSAIS
ncbi:amino acid transporter, partial [Genlisea aurea]